jgi:iron uptake system component EfeO
MKPFKPFAVAALCTALGSACNRGPEPQQRARVAQETKRLLAAKIDEWLVASKELRSAAPTPEGRGWDAQQDAATINAMKAAWQRARVAYEHIEGAIAPMFPESDMATDARYEDFLLKIGPGGDRIPFDGEGVIGSHGIERVLWADSTPEDVVRFEKGLPGYRPAAFPATETEARDFKDKLAARMVSDIEKLKKDFEPLELDLSFAFNGLIDLAVEQVEKVDKAATGQDESRYAQLTMVDLRANREGCLRAYQVFRPWVQAQPDGKAVDAKVMAAFARLEAAYAKVDGDAIPKPPTRWSGLDPAPADLETPFGELFAAVRREADDKVADSLHASLLAVAEKLELPEIVRP